MAVDLEYFSSVLKEILAYIDLFAPALMVVVIFMGLWQFVQHRKRVRYLEITLGALMKHTNIEFDDASFVPVEVRTALDKGLRLKAIRLYRKITGANLKEAIEVVDGLLKKT